MTDYVRTEAGEVVEESLPTVGVITIDGEEHSVSNYHLLEPDVLKAEGWVPAVDEPPAVDPADGWVEPSGWDITAEQARRIYTLTYYVPSLAIDRPDIPADGATAATVTYRHPDPDTRPAEVIFDVNGATATVALAGSIAELAVTAAQPGIIEVTVPGVSPITITAS